MKKSSLGLTGVAALVLLLGSCRPANDDSSNGEVMQSDSIEEILELGRRVDEDFWAGFSPVSEEEVRQVERQIGRKLPQDFREFYLRVGWNSEETPGSGFNIYSPEELVEELSLPIFFVTGSRTPGEEWCSIEEHEEFWLSQGEKNPAPAKFTNEILDFHGLPLWSLLQVGGDGIGAALCVYTGEDLEPPYRFCAIHQSVIWYQADSFLEGLAKRLESDLEEDSEL